MLQIFEDFLSTLVGIFPNVRAFFNFRLEISFAYLTFIFNNEPWLKRDILIYHFYTWMIFLFFNSKIITIF